MQKESEAMENNNLKQIIGQRIRECRLKAGYTQAQFAELMDISINFLSEIETGKKGMSQETIYKLCQKLQLSADYILFGSRTPDPLPCDLIQLVNSLTSEDLHSLMDYILALQKVRRIQGREEA